MSEVGEIGSEEQRAQRGRKEEFHKLFEIRIFSVPSAPKSLLSALV
jgi:hypothetical protein